MGMLVCRGKEGFRKEGRVGRREGVKEGEEGEGRLKARYVVG